MSKEYDFRFPGLSPISPTDKENTLRVKAVRNAILRIANGFTEIPTGICTDLIPGEGMGYIVNLESKKQAVALEKALGRVAKGWGTQTPTLTEAAKGPRNGFSFVLIPERANADPTGFRRLLFRTSRWVQIETAFGGVKPLRVEAVYGEWKPNRFQKSIQDESRMFVVPDASRATQKRLENIIQVDVFDGGSECDQACIYLSCGGRSVYVDE